jgi:hypothetical protein
MKTFNIMYNVGKSKYIVRFHNGEKIHTDGSKFFDINIFKNKKTLNKFVSELIIVGYIKL